MRMRSNTVDENAKTGLISINVGSRGLFRLLIYESRLKILKFSNLEFKFLMSDLKNRGVQIFI